MRNTIVMPVEGILRKPIGGQRNDDGFRLYRAMIREYGIILVSEGVKDTTLDWLEKEGITGYDDVIFYGSLRVNILEGFWVNILRTLQMRGCNLSLALVNDPVSARDVLERGVPVLMFSQPAYGLPEWLPGAGRKAEAWNDLVMKVEANRLARMMDTRMSEGPE